MKHLGCLTFCVFMVLLMTPLGAVFGGGSGNFDDPWLIENPAQLDSLRYYLNNTGHYFKQVADIDLDIAPYNAGSGWMAIGSTQSNNFRGSYDGDGFSITGLYINRASTANQGLFGYIQSARLQNIHLVNLNVTGGNSTGGLVGYLASGSSVTNCHSVGTVNGYGYSVGGLLGSSNHATITDCSSAGFVNGPSDTHYSSMGGLLGGMYHGSIAGCHSSATVYSALYNTAGGLIGSASGICQITESSASGNVSVRSRAGGFIGYNYDGPAIQYCHATGNVEVTGEYEYACGGFVGTSQKGNDYSTPSISMCFSTGNATANGQVGGFIGRLVGGIVQKCFSSGTASGQSRIGGFCGSSLSTSSISDCYSSGQVQAAEQSGGFIGSNDTPSTVSRCFNYGAITFSGSYYVGGFAGLASAADFSSCYWDTQSTGITVGTCGEGRTTTQMTDPYDTNTYVGFLFYSVWGPDTAYIYNLGYPYLLWRYLSQPTSIWMSNSGGIINLHWDAVTGANSYKIYYSTDPDAADAGWLLLGSTASQEYLVPVGPRMFFRVVASSVIVF